MSKKQKSFCVCRRGEYGVMINCYFCPDDEWYHAKCMGLPPKGINNLRNVWKCPKCVFLDGGETSKDEVILKQLGIGFNRYESSDGILLAKLNIILKEVMNHRDARPFNAPVDVKGLQLKDYFDVVKDPMDFGMINARLEDNTYANPSIVIKDIKRVFANCYLYNRPGDDVTIMAKAVENYFDERLSKLGIANLETIGKEALDSKKIDKKVVQKIATVAKSETKPDKNTFKPSNISFKSSNAMDEKVKLRKLANILKSVMKHKYAWPFNIPVDVEGLELKDYFNVVKKPIDLGTISTRLDKDFYSETATVINDVKLVFSNCYLYNRPEDDVTHMAKEVEKYFDAKISKIEIRSMDDEMSQILGADQNDKIRNETLQCICNKLLQEVMIGCDATSCPKGWFHLSCVGLAEIPKGEWYCPMCRKSSKWQCRGDIVVPFIKSLSRNKHQIVEKSKDINDEDNNLNLEFSKKISISNKENGSSDNTTTKKSRTTSKSSTKGQNGNKGKISTSNSKQNKNNSNSPKGISITYEEKRKLSLDINSLSSENIGMLVELARECEPSLQSGDPDELELDFEMLKPSTLIKLKEFVEGCLQKDWVEWTKDTEWGHPGLDISDEVFKSNSKDTGVASPSHNKDSTSEVLSFKTKQKLHEEIDKLAGDEKILEVAKLIQECEPSIKLFNDDELEIDLEVMKESTLRNIVQLLAIDSP